MDEDEEIIVGIGERERDGERECITYTRTKEREIFPCAPQYGWC